MRFSLATLFAPLITALTPSFLTAVDIVLVMTVLLTGLWAHWSLVKRIIGFIRGLQMDKKYVERAKKRSQYQQYKKDNFDWQLRSYGIDVDEYHRTHGEKNDTSRGRSSRSWHR